MKRWSCERRGRVHEIGLGYESCQAHDRRGENQIVDNQDVLLPPRTVGDDDVWQRERGHSLHVLWCGPSVLWPLCFVKRESQ